MSSSELTRTQLRHFAEKQYLAQWEQHYGRPGGWPVVFSAKLSSEQVDAMHPFVDSLLRESESSGRHVLVRLDRITKYFFVEWLKTRGHNDFLVKEHHKLRFLSQKDIETIFERITAEHAKGKLFELQHWFVEACHFLEAREPATDEVSLGGA